MSQTFVHAFWDKNADSESIHKYYRLSVEAFVESFCGWAALKELMEYTVPGRDRSFFCALFETGGRALETLELKGSNFSVLKDEGIMLVKGMKLEKRYKKTEEYLDEQQHRRWFTQQTEATRKTFPIVLKEPLAQILVEWIQGKDDYLFASKDKRRVGLPMSRSWAYKTVRFVDSILPEDLRERLGLNVPFVKDGKQIKDTIHLWLHWFRSQRASQLNEDYGYELMDLMEWFSWTDQKTALRYAKKGWRGLAAKMKNVKTHYV